jgi:uncharacterized membrane protein
MNPAAEKKSIDQLFLWSMIVKAAGGLFEVCSGIGTLFLTTNEVLHATQMLVDGKLAADPDAFFANYILDLASRWTPGQTNLFLFSYLFGHGLINLFLVVALLRKKMWAYPLSLAIFGAFVAYEAWQFLGSQSPILGAFTLFDLAVVGLVWREYAYVRRRRASAK